MTDLTLDEFRDLPGKELEQRLKREAGVFCNGSDGHENGQVSKTDPEEKAWLLYDILRSLKGASALLGRVKA